MRPGIRMVRLAEGPPMPRRQPPVVLVALLSLLPALARAQGYAAPPAVTAPAMSGPEFAAWLGGGPHGLLLGMEGGWRSDRLRGGLALDVQAAPGDRSAPVAGGPTFLDRADFDLATSAGLVTTGTVPDLFGRPPRVGGHWRADLSLEAGRTFARVNEIPPPNLPDGRTRWMGFWFVGLRGRAVLLLPSIGQATPGFGLGAFLRLTAGREAELLTAAGVERGGRLVGGVYLDFLLDFAGP